MRRHVRSLSFWASALAIAGVGLVGCGSSPADQLTDATGDCVDELEEPDDSVTGQPAWLSIREDSVSIDEPSEDGDPDELVASLFTTVCILERTDAPDYVVSQMESTRALDGRQSTEWGDYAAEWTYHPDDGLDVLFRTNTS